MRPLRILGWFVLFVAGLASIGFLAAVGGAVAATSFHAQIAPTIPIEVAQRLAASAALGIVLALLALWLAPVAGMSRLWTVGMLLPVLGILGALLIAGRLARRVVDGAESVGMFEDGDIVAATPVVLRSRWRSGGLAFLAVLLVAALATVGTFAFRATSSHEDEAAMLPVASEGTRAGATAVVTPLSGDPAEVATRALMVVDVYRENRLLYGVSSVLLGDSRHLVVSLVAASAGDQINVRYQPPSGLMRVFRTVPVAFDESLSLAVLLLEDAAGPPLAMAPQEARVGDTVTLAGFIAGDSWKVKADRGTVAEITTPGASRDVRWMRSVVVLPANGTGGIMLDEQGRVLGFATSRPGAPIWDRTQFLSVGSARAFLDRALVRTDRVDLPPPPQEALRASGAAPPATGGAALPFKVYGENLKPGQVVEARRGTTVVGRATASSAGTWSIDVQPRDASRGDVIALWLDGADSGRTFTFIPGQFSAPPGIVFAPSAIGCVLDDRPYKAYGSRLNPGQIVEAFVGTTAVGRAVADASGNWYIDVQSKPPLVAGARLTFTLDGASTGSAVTFCSGQFAAPPGIALRRQ